MIDTPIHWDWDNCSESTILAVNRPVIGTNKERGDILLKGYLVKRVFHIP